MQRSGLLNALVALPQGKVFETGWYMDPRVYRYLIQVLPRWEPLMLAQWLRYSATNRKVTGSIPDGVIGIFH
jgi:hypothetical protein